MTMILTLTAALFIGGPMDARDLDVQRIIFERHREVALAELRVSVLRLMSNSTGANFFGEAAVRYEPIQSSLSATDAQIEDIDEAFGEMLQAFRIDALAWTMPEAKPASAQDAASRAVNLRQRTERMMELLRAIATDALVAGPAADADRLVHQLQNLARAERVSANESDALIQRMAAAWTAVTEALETTNDYMRQVKRYVDAGKSLFDTAETARELSATFETRWARRSELTATIRSGFAEAIAEARRAAGRTNEEAAAENALEALSANVINAVDATSLTWTWPVEEVLTPGRRLQPAVGEFLRSLANVLVRADAAGVLAWYIRGHCDVNRGGGHQPRFRRLISYDAASPDMIQDSVLDQVDAEGQLALFENYYLYRIVPSLPNWNSVLVYNDEAYREERGRAIEVTAEWAQLVGFAIHQVDRRLPNPVWVQSVGVGFLEPESNNVPFDVPAAELPETKALNNRIEVSLVEDQWTSVRWAVDEIEQRFYRALRES